MYLGGSVYTSEKDMEYTFSEAVNKSFHSSDVLSLDLDYSNIFAEDLTPSNIEYENSDKLSNHISNDAKKNLEKVLNKIEMNYEEVEKIQHLLTGVTLAAEINSSNPNLRGFISIFAYQYKEFGEFVEFDEFLKRVNEEEIFFLLRKYELLNECVENGWWVIEEDLVNSIYIEDIKGIKEVEIEILKYIEDITILKPEWHCDILT